MDGTFLNTWKHIGDNEEKQKSFIFKSGEKTKLGNFKLV